MPVGEIITIGTELLLGEIQDTNTAYLARIYRDLGIDLYRTMTVGDNQERIAQAIREALTRSQIIITTGGLGPTVDDPTRQAVAQAIGVELEFCPELWDQVQERFLRFHRTPTENNRRQAYIPVGAVAIENPVGTAPAFYFEKDGAIIISLPGVPREMETLIHQKVIPLLRARFDLKGIIKAHVLHTAGVGESQVDEWIGDLELLSNPTVGLAAHPGQIDIRVTVKAGSEVEADQMIAEYAAKIRDRVGLAIYGSDSETLESVLVQRLTACNWNLSIVECGFEGRISERLIKTGTPSHRILTLDQLCSPADLQEQCQSLMINTGSQVTLGAGFYPGDVQQNLYLFLLTPHGMFEANRSYGGPPALGLSWAVNTALDFIRRNIP